MNFLGAVLILGGECSLQPRHRLVGLGHGCSVKEENMIAGFPLYDQEVENRKTRKTRKSRKDHKEQKSRKRDRY
jgi:hypothetical protein